MNEIIVKSEQKIDIDEFDTGLLIENLHSTIDNELWDMEINLCRVTNYDEVETAIIKRFLNDLAVDMHWHIEVDEMPKELHHAE